VDGDGCTEYAAWCRDGTYLEGAWAPGETFATYENADGLDAGEACCVCGGGSLEPETAPSRAPTHAPIHQPTFQPTRQPTAAPTAATYTQLAGPVCSPANHVLAQKQLWGSGRTFDQCKNRCTKTSPDCNFFLFQTDNGFCRLFVTCDEAGRVDPSKGGASYQRDHVVRGLD